MKRLQLITGAVLVLALLVMGINALILPLPDWTACYCSAPCLWRPSPPSEPARGHKIL